MHLPKHRPPIHPGEMLIEEFLRPMRLAQVEAARRMKMPLTRLNEIVDAVGLSFTHRSTGRILVRGALLGF